LDIFWRGFELFGLSSRGNFWTNFGPRIGGVFFGDMAPSIDDLAATNVISGPNPPGPVVVEEMEGDCKAKSLYKDADNGLNSKEATATQSSVNGGETEVNLGGGKKKKKKKKKGKKGKTVSFFPTYLRG
jgi:hypothetical protein